MLRVLSRERLREFDKLATAECGVPSIVLMENAGRGAADVVEAELAVAPGRVVVIAGRGNNGGDGYVVARHLLLRGVEVEVFALAPEPSLTGDALINRHAFSRSGGVVVDVASAESSAFDLELDGADVVVDAIFGTGLSRPLDDRERAVIAHINAAHARRVALDLPSGLDADTGVVHDEAVRADVTVTFAAHKMGLLTPNGVVHRGRLELADIGVPQAALSALGEDAWLVEEADVRAALKRRTAAAHKVSSGRVLVLAGSAGKIGAALLVAHGAARTGAGLVTLAGLPEVAERFDARVLEAMSARLDPAALESSLDALLGGVDAVAIGPGLGFSAEAARIIERVVLDHPGPVVVDADAISHFKGAASGLAEARGQRVLTPHAGELSRLLGITSREVESDRLGSLRHAVELTRACVLLKGPHTAVAAPGKLPVFGPEGAPVLATGGSGDVLTGMIAALACELEPFVAAYAGVFLHAFAGMRRAASGVDRGLLAHEIADGVPDVIADLSAGSPLLPV